MPCAAGIYETFGTYVRLGPISADPRLQGKRSFSGHRHSRISGSTAGKKGLADSGILQGLGKASPLSPGPPFPRESVKHSVSEYVNGMAHINGAESFWALLKRGFHGIYHQMSPRHLPSYISEFEGRFNDRNLDTLHQMENIAIRMIGKRLLRKELHSR